MRAIHAVVSNVPTAAQPSDVMEYYVPAHWIKVVSLDQEVKEKRFFGNQNTVAKPKAKKWVHTVDRLKIRFGVRELERHQSFVLRSVESPMEAAWRRSS